MQTYATLAEEEQGIVYHVSEPNRSRWSHIDDLDSFFSRVYYYHQCHGFLCILLTQLATLHKYMFIMCFTAYMIYGIQYDKLFSPPMGEKISLVDVLLPVSECVAKFDLKMWICVMLAVLLLIWKVLHKGHKLIQAWDIKKFYNTVLKIHDKDLDNKTWGEIMTKLKQAQIDIQMCIHKRELTELDIYHRILRQENYFVAMVNKGLLPPRLTVPVLGEIVYLTKGLTKNLEFLFFSTPWSLFENSWHLKNEYKHHENRLESAAKLRRLIIWQSVANVALCLLVVLYQILFYFFTYFETIRREPGSFGVRYWSLYAQYYFRHFNELDHELHMRLSKAYKPASKYLAAFSSPVGAIIADHVTFVCGAVLSVAVILSFYDNDVFYVEGLFTLLAVLSGIIAACRSMIPDQSIIYNPETLLSAVVLCTHYLPGEWQSNAHTTKVRSEFQQLFQFRFSGLLEELFAPILTPFFLMFSVYPKALDIVDFFRKFTVSVVGVGDVCSFAEMDVHRNGDPSFWDDSVPSPKGTDQYDQCKDGKIELSLMYFSHNNPEWLAPLPTQQQFVDAIVTSGESNIFRPSSVHTLNYVESDLDIDALQMTRDRRVSRISSTTEMPNDYFASAQNMRASTMLLHRRHFENNMRTAEEYTPLLSSNPH